MHAVLICDVRKSREIENWEKVVEKIKGVLDEVNERFRESIVGSFKMTVGDEFQGVLRFPERAYGIYKFIKYHVPVSLYCGVGIGEVEIPVEDYGGARRSAFYNARDAVDECKKMKRVFFLKSPSKEVDDIVNTIAYLIECIESTWTERQKEVVKFHISHPEMSYEGIGRVFGITKQGVSGILKRAKWDAIENGIEVIESVLKSVNSKKFTSKSKHYDVYQGM